MSILKSDKPLYLSLLHPRDFKRFSRPVLWSANSPSALGPGLVRSPGKSSRVQGLRYATGDSAISRLTSSIGCSKSMSRLFLDSERQLCVQSQLKPWAVMADRGRSAVNDSIQVCQIWRFDNMCPNDRLDRPPLIPPQTISHAGHAMLQKEELWSTKEFRLECDDRLIGFLR